MSYEEETRTFYQNDAKAQEYHAWYTTRGGLNGWRFRHIAQKERDAVARLLRLVPHARVIDVPAGTGKMAPVFKASSSTVLACDVSQNMLSFAEAEYRRVGVDAEFKVLDLEFASTQITEPVDVTVCVRLMHRLPEDLRTRMLGEIAKLSKHAIVSFAVDSPYERFRRRLRRMLFSKGGDGVPVHETWPTREALEADLGRQFTIVQRTPVGELISSEVMYLLRSDAA